MSTTFPAVSRPAEPLPADERADAEHVIAAAVAGRKPDPEVARRVRARSAEERKRLLAAKGVQDIGVEIIRELRGELPNP